jgi:hypothetical protein
MRRLEPLRWPRFAEVPSCGVVAIAAAAIALAI